jgi:hypothetical protein
MKRKPKPATYEEARMAMAEAQVAAIMMKPSQAEQDRASYLNTPVDRAEPKVLFDTALRDITGAQDSRRALAGPLSTFRKFLLEQRFSPQEVEQFITSRADLMPPLKRSKICEPDWWDFGGFLQSEVPILKALFTKWASAKRLENLPKGEKKSLTVHPSPKRLRNVPEKVPKRA